MKNLFIFVPFYIHKFFLGSSKEMKINAGFTPITTSSIFTRPESWGFVVLGELGVTMIDRNKVSDLNLNLRSFKLNNSNPCNVFKVTTWSLMHPAYFRQLLSKEGMRLQITDRCKGLSRRVICLDNGESFVLSVIERVFRSVRLTKPAPIQRVQGITLLS